MKNKTKFIFAILITIIILIGITLFLKNKEEQPLINITVEETKANINSLYIYGNHMNLAGDLELNSPDTIKKVSLAFLGKKDIEYDLTITKINGKIRFQISDKKNNGILLDNIEKNNYLLFIKTTDNDEVIKYYPIKNNTEYKQTNYNTISKNGKTNNISIHSEEKYQTLAMDVVIEKDNNSIYDIVIDAGHGGLDSGACYNRKCETDYTLTLAKKLKEKLEAKGFKIKLTRDTNTLNKNELLDTYGTNGRIAIPGNVKAKYLFSFHLNSGASTRNGVEIYTANNIDYTLASLIADNLISNTNTNYSNNQTAKIKNGVYTRTFQNQEIQEMKKDAIKENYEPYNVTTETPYYYIIRETGGAITNAYTDGRNKDKDYNPYYKSNVGVESYIMEIGYITSSKDVTNIEAKLDKYVEAVELAIAGYIK